MTIISIILSQRSDNIEDGFSKKRYGGGSGR